MAETHDDPAGLLRLAQFAAPGLTLNGLDNRHDQHAWSDRALPEVAACARWIRRWTFPRQTINNRWSSYGLKHLVEDSAEAHDIHHYVCNGAFIAAAIGLGYAWRPTAGSGINAYFAMGFARWINEPRGWDRIRPCCQLRDAAIARMSIFDPIEQVH